MTTNTRSFSHFKRGEKNPPKMSFNNRFPPSKNIRHRSSWGPNTVNHFQKADVPRLSPEEEDFDFYPERLHLIKSRQLIPLQEDLADWLNKLLNIDYITGDNFFDALDNGAVLCRLGRLIQDKAKIAVENGSVKGPVPTIQKRCWENAARSSFFSRDNMENFIQFCRRLGIHQNLLFESDDLVLHRHPKNVVLCLLEVGRISSKHYGIEAPALVELEREIDAEQERDHCLSDSGISHSSLPFQSPSPTESPGPPSDERLKHSSSVMEMSTASEWMDPAATPTSDVADARGCVSEMGANPGSDGVPSDTTEDDWSRGSPDDPDEGISPARSPSPMSTGTSEHGGSQMSDLDRKVRKATEAVQRLCQCPSSKCNKLKVKKVGEGLYHIAGRNVFIRLLKGRHMMVRVGGGWDTLDHFLTRHDPCQVRYMSRESCTPNPSPRNNNSSSGSLLRMNNTKHAGSTDFLHIRAKYRSTPSVVGLPLPAR